MELLENYEPLLKALWFIAIPASLIFIIQSIMTFIGMDSSDGTDADFDSNLHDTDTPFQLFSFRNLINFLLGFSWTGIAFYSTIESKFVLTAIAIIIGLAFVAGFFLIMLQMHKFAEDNSFKIENTLHKTCSVYLTIPEKKKGSGKVLVSVNGAFHEINAITENERLETGTMVRVTRVESNSLIVVEKV